MRLESRNGQIQCDHKGLGEDLQLDLQLVLRSVRVVVVVGGGNG